MNIYDEAIEEIEDTMYESMNTAQLPKTVKALKRAKKEHELLGLYRKHINTLCKKSREGVKNSMFSSEHLAYELYEKIKQLEEELK